MVTKKLFLVLFLFFWFGCYFVALMKIKQLKMLTSNICL